MKMFTVFLTFLSRVGSVPIINGTIPVPLPQKRTISVLIPIFKKGIVPFHSFMFHFVSFKKGIGNSEYSADPDHPKIRSPAKKQSRSCNTLFLMIRVLNEKCLP